jgi:predicted transcriptional regulator
MKIKKMISIGLVVGFMEASAGMPAPIDGIGFKDWAAANAYVTRGMSKEKVAEILGVSVSAWETTDKKWSQNLKKLMRQDFSIMNTYGAVLKNPKVGKFANVGGEFSIEKLLEKVPTYDKYIEILAYSESRIANKADLNLEKAYSLTAQQWSQVSMHWSDYMKKKVWFNAPHKEMIAHRAEVKKFQNYDRQLTAKWKKHFMGNVQDR